MDFGDQPIDQMFEKKFFQSLQKVSKNPKTYYLSAILRKLTCMVKSTFFKETLKQTIMGISCVIFFSFFGPMCPALHVCISMYVDILCL